MIAPRNTSYNSKNKSLTLNRDEWEGYLHIHLTSGFMNNNYSFLFCLLYRRAAGLLSFSI
jgi:hypothetical protein